MSQATLLKGGCVLTLGAKTSNHPEADLLIRDGRVVEVGQGIRARDAEMIDATDTIVMPGFIDAHRHLTRSLFRNTGDATTTIDRFGPDDVYASTLVGLLGAVEAGITTVVDWCEVGDDPGYDETVTQAHLDSGARTVLVRAGRDGVTPTPRPHGGERAPGIVAYGAPDPRPGGVEALAESWSKARSQGQRVHAHVGSDTADRGVVVEMAERGLLGEDVTLVHCTNLGEADLGSLARHRVSVVVTPTGEMASGMGLPPIQKLIDLGMRPGLGVEDESLGPGDMFAQMRAAISIQHATYFDLKLAGKGGLPNLLSTREVIRYGTIEGAAAVGLGSVIGSIEPGKQADIIVLRTDRPNIAPVNDPIGAVVWGMDTSNLDWVFVAGRALMREGELQADVSHVRGLAAKASSRLGPPTGTAAGVSG